MQQETQEAWSQNQAHWQEHSDRFENLDKQLANTLESLQNGYKDFADTTSVYIDKLDKNTSGITNKLSGAIAELSEVLEDMPTNTASPVRR